VLGKLTVFTIIVFIIVAFIIVVTIVAWVSRKWDVSYIRHARLNGPGHNLVLHWR
jgi:hypothetical protein